MDLDQLEAIARAATPGPWHLYEKSRYFYVKGSGDGHTFVLQRKKFMSKEDDSRPRADCQLIAAANPSTVLALIAVAKAAREVCAAGRSGREEAIDDLDAALSVFQEKPHG